MVGCAHASGGGIALSSTSNTSGAYRHPLGQRLIYSLGYHNTAATDFTALFRASKANPTPGSILAASYATHVDSRLQFTMMGYHEDLAVMDVRFLSPLVTLDVDGHRQLASAIALQLDTAKPIIAEIDPSGRIASIRFDAAVAPRAQTLANTLLALGQFVVRHSSDLSRCVWQATESDPNGAYMAEYAAVPCSHNISARAYQTYVKKWVRYFTRPSTHGTNANLPTIILPTGALHATFGRDAGQLLSLDGALAQVVELSGHRVAASKTTLQYRLLTTQEMGATQLDALRDADSALLAIAPTSLSSQPEAASLQAAVQSQVLGSDTVDTLHAQVAALTAVARGHFPTQLYLKLKALFWLEPQSSARFEDVLDAGSPDGAAFQIVGLALGTVGNAAAQATLVAAIQRRSGDVQAVDVLLSDLVRAPQPTAETVNAVRTLATSASNHNVEGTAQLALGALARNLATTSPADADAIIDLLVKGENSAATPGKINTLLSLGNAGSTRALPAIRAGLVDPSADVRSAAATALRWVPSPDADAALARLLLSDREPGVRLAAALALSFRSPTAAGFEAERVGFARDSNEAVRVRALIDIWMVHSFFPQARTIVRSATKDPSANVRKTATELIAG
jgi:HEAT repeat protein